MEMRENSFDLERNWDVTDGGTDSDQFEHLSFIC